MNDKRSIHHVYGVCGIPKIGTVYSLPFAVYCLRSLRWHINYVDFQFRSIGTSRESGPFTVYYGWQSPASPTSGTAI